MEVTIGVEGLSKTFQGEFPEETECCYCKGIARIGFVAHEGMSNQPIVAGENVCNLHPNDPGGEGFWLHDCACFATYLCKECLNPTTLYNQG